MKQIKDVEVEIAAWPEGVKLEARMPVETAAAYNNMNNVNRSGVVHTKMNGYHDT